MLQRIYGTAWDTADELDQHLWRLEEAKKRDHRKLGRELDLFTFHPESPAAPFLHPRGMALWRALEDWSLRGPPRRRVPRGAHAEPRPQGAVGDLRPLGQLPGQHVRPRRLRPCQSGLKPMNCPEEMLIYRTRARSYRELPMRFTDYSVALPQRADGRPGRHVPRPSADPGRLPRLLPRGPSGRRAAACAFAGAQPVRAVRLRAAGQAGHAAGEADRLRRVLGARGGAAA